jgi:PTH1 family peptidyl-tRNA hydrolase
MKLVVGLGNPGRTYEKTRHNIGFWVVERLASLDGTAVWSKGFEGLVTDVRLAGEKVKLLKPTTFMNRSGRSVREAFDFYKVELGSLLIVCDDFSLKVGKFRFRSKGSSGGQNGLKDIVMQLGTEEFSRLRVGIGSPGPRDPADFVLSEFSASEKTLVDDCVIEAARAVESWCRDGIDVAMNEFNGKDLSKE